MEHGPFNMGWILTMFDLPVTTKQERKVAANFRKNLLDDGYQMMQFSVYMRVCHDYERMKKHAGRIKKFSPEVGNIRIIFITDKQWLKSINISCKEYMKKKKKKQEPPVMQEIFEFW